MVHNLLPLYDSNVQGGIYRMHKSHDHTVLI